MNLIRFNQQPSFSNFFENFEKSTNRNVPMVNISNEEKNYVVELAAPGLEKEDFSIKLENYKLSISTKKEIEKEETNDFYTVKEFSVNSFSRSFILPKNIEFDQVNADYKNGILTVKLPKKELEPKLDREIAIS